MSGVGLFQHHFYFLGVRNMDRQILVAEEVAEMLRIDKQRVYELVRTNQIPFIRLGERQYRFSATAIQTFLSSGGTQKVSDEQSCGFQNNLVNQNDDK
jgi:excisionase family DNA binding protein